VKSFRYDIDDEFAFSVVNLKGDRKYYGEGYASTIDEDKAGEVLLPSAQADLVSQLKSQVITLDVEHEEWYSEEGKILPRPKASRIPVAKVVEAELRPKGAWIKAELNTNIARFKEVWGSIKDGFLKAFSVAFYPVKKSSGNEKFIEKLNLMNITLTGTPMNPNATFRAVMKSAANIEGDIMEEKIEEKIEVDVKAEPIDVKSEVLKEVETMLKSAKDEFEVQLKSLSEELKLKDEKIAKLEADLKAEQEKPVMKSIPSQPEMIEQKAVFTPLAFLR